jgi:hypothetical protein
MKETTLSALVIGLCLFSMPQLSFAEPGEKKDVKDIYGRTVQVQDNDNNLPTVNLILKAYQVAQFKKVSTKGLMLGPLKESEYQKFASDEDMGPIISIARADHKNAIVFVMPSGPHSKISAVLFNGDLAASFVEGATGGSKVTPEALRKSLSQLPAKIPASGGEEKEGYMRLRPGQVVADNGQPLETYQVMYEGKPEVPWPFADKNKGQSPAQTKDR